MTQRPISTSEASPLPEAVSVAASFSLYSTLTHAYGQASPQHQGLTADEFDRALTDPRVAKTAVERDGQILWLPQLAPVEHNVWLNADFYERTYPEQYARGDVMQYVDIPGIEPGPEVLERLRDVASRNGIIVFDYPEADPQYPQRVEAVLQRAGVLSDENALLGSQTYFAGQVSLKRKQPEDQPEAFATVFEKMVKGGEYDMARMENGASLRAFIDDDQAEQMRQFYDDAYVVLNDHPCAQGLSPDEFYDMMTEKEWVTKIVNSNAGKIGALCLLDNNLEELSWVNAAYYQEQYPEKYAAGQVVWFPGLAADPNSDVVGNTERMVGLIAELVERGNNDMLVVFDCCDMNTAFLPAVLNGYINNTPEASIDIQPIAVQRYVGLKTSLQG